MSAATEALRNAREAYEHAVAGWRAEQARGGIIELDKTDRKDMSDWLAGQRWKTTTQEGARAMGHFQKAKAELDAADFDVRRERGMQTREVEPARGSAIDTRLPIEREPEEEAWT